MKYDKLPRIICNLNTLDDVIIYCTCMFTDLYFRNQPTILIVIYIYILCLDGLRDVSIPAN